MNTRAGVVCGSLLAEEIPTVLSVSGLCVFFGVARVTPPAVLFYRPTPLLVASEACSPSDKSATAPNPSAELPELTIPPQPLHAHTIYMSKQWVLSPVSLQGWHKWELCASNRRGHELLQVYPTFLCRNHSNPLQHLPERILLLMGC